MLLGYFKQLRLGMEDERENSNKVLELIQRPLSLIAEKSKDVVYFEFCKAFLSNGVTTSLKNKLIPYMHASRNFPYHGFLHYLNSTDYYDDTNTLLYFVLALESPHYGKFT